MADLELIVDSKDVVSAQSETTKLERNLKRLFDRYSKGAVTNGVYEKSLKQITQEYQKLGVSSQKATGQVRKYTRDLQQEKAATEQSRRAKEEAKEAQRRLNEETRKAKEEAKRLAQQERERAADLKATSKAMDQHEAEMESLRLKYDQTYRITKQYEAGLEEIRMAHMAGALSAEQMEREIESLGLEFQKMQKGQKTWSNQFVQGSALAAKSTNRFGYISQQVGYQVGDFFVQMQSGTNVFVAFGQQATQLAGLLPGLAGAVVGIGISIGTALLAAWSRSRKEAEESKTAYDRLSESLNNLDKYSVDLVKSNEKIKSSFESIIGVVQEINAKALKKSLSDITEPFEEEIENLKVFMKERQELAKNMGSDSSISSLEKGITIDVLGLDKYKEVVRVGELFKTIQGETREELAKSLNIVSQTLDKEGLRTEEVDALLAKYSESIGVNKIALSTFEDQKRELEDQLALKQKELQFGKDSLQVLNEEMRQKKASLVAQIKKSDATEEEKKQLYEIVPKLIEAERATLSAKNATEGAVSATTRWANMMSNVGAEISGIMSSLSQLGGGVIDTAAKAARIKTLQEGGSVKEGIIAEKRSRFDAQLRKEAIGANIFEKSILKARKALFEFNLEQDETIAKLEEKASRTKYSPGGGSGSGDSGVKSFIDLFIGDEDTFQVKREKLDEWLQSTMDRYSEFNAAELEILRQHNINKLSIEQEYQDRLNEIKRQEKDAQLSHYQNFFGAMASVFESGGSKLLGISKAFALAEAAVSIWRGAAKALELPFPANLAAWAQVLATGAKAIQGISSASRGKSSLGGGGAASGSIATPANTNASPQKVYIEGLDADSLISGRMLSEIFDKFYEENEERGAVFMVKGA